ncbi:hypothetical protein BGZ90_005177 [Linnemannia elongata]|nr:hypothetical protein BGZ90_005177 [Linnemannia elongata]
MAEGSGSIDSGVETLSERTGRGAGSGALGEEVGVGRVNQRAGIASQEPGSLVQKAKITSAKAFTRKLSPMDKTCIDSLSKTGRDPLPLHEGKSKNIQSMDQEPFPRQKASSARGQPKSE